MSVPRCAKSDRDGLIPDNEEADGEGNTRKRRWARLGNVVWGSDNMPLIIRFKNYISALSKSDQEAAARHCADVSIRFSY